MIPGINSIHGARPLGSRSSRHHLHHDLDRIHATTSDQVLGSRARIAEHYDRIWLGQEVNGKDQVKLCLTTVISQPQLWPTITERKLYLSSGAKFNGMTILGFCPPVASLSGAPNSLAYVRAGSMIFVLSAQDRTYLILPFRLLVKVLQAI